MTILNDKTIISNVFSISDIPKCSRRPTYPTACLTFQLPDDMIRSDVSKAELWIHKNSEIPRGSNHSITIMEGLIGSEKSSRKATPMIGESLLSGTVIIYQHKYSAGVTFNF